MLWEAGDCVLDTVVADRNCQRVPSSSSQSNSPIILNVYVLVTRAESTTGFHQ